MSGLLGFLQRVVHNMGLLPRLLIAEVGVLALVFSGGIFLIGQMTATLKENIRQDRLLVGQILAGDLDSSLEHSISELRQLGVGYQQAVAENDPSGVMKALELISGESTVFTHGILLVGPGGGVMAVDRRQPDLMYLDLSRVWPELWDTVDGSGEAVTSAFWLEGRDSPSVAIAVPIGDPADGRFSVGLMGANDSYVAMSVTRAIHLGSSGHAEIVDALGITLFSTVPESLLQPSRHVASYQAMLDSHEPHIMEVPRIDESGGREKHLMAVVPLESLPWALSSGTTVSEAYASVDDLWLGGLAFMSVLTAIAFVATVFVGRRLVRPVKVLNRAARDVVEGASDTAVDIPWGGEIGELGQSLETMRRYLRDRGSELEEQVKQRTVELQERNRELNVLSKTLRVNEEHLRNLLGKVLGAQEDERRRVSRDLHDEIGQALSALSMGMERLEQAGPERWPDLQGELLRLKGLANDTLGDLGRITVALRPAALDDLGLVHAIRRYARLYLGAANIAFDIQQEGPTLDLNRALEVVVYRVVQEAINNVTRHSGARNVKILLEANDGSVRAMVTDDGKGFDGRQEFPGNGFGIQGMEERATLVGGRLSVSSEPGSGTTVTLEIPK